MKAAERREAATAGRCLVGGLLSAILYGACGLPFTSTLQPPVGCQDPEIADVLSFCGSAAGPLFSGYEIYYIIIAAAEETPDASHYQDLRHGFGRLSRGQDQPCNSDDPPLVYAVDAESDHTVSLDLTLLTDVPDPSGAEPFLRMSWRPGQSETVGRYKPDEFGECIRFSARDRYETGDKDITNAAVDSIATGGLIDLVAYAVSYGRDRGEPRYSAPLLIGRVELVLPFG